MAILNYLTPGTYSVVDVITYYKEGAIHFDLQIYSDNTKIDLLATKKFQIEAFREIRQAKCRGLNVPPASPQDKDCYIIGSEPTGEWAEYPNIIAVYDQAEAKWGFWFFGGNEFIYIQDEDQYFSYNAVTHELVPIKVYNDKRLYDTFFTQQLINQNGMQDQAYSYLKSLPEFQGTSDG